MQAQTVTYQTCGIYSDTGIDKIFVPVNLDKKERWTRTELMRVVALNRKLLTSEQIVLLQARLDEYNEDAVQKMADIEELFEFIVTDTCEEHSYNEYLIAQASE